MIADSSQHLYAWNAYIYGEKVATLTEELPTKLSLTNAAGRNGKRIGENFQDIKRLIVNGMLSEDSDENLALANPLPLRAIVQRFRNAHRAEIGKGKLYLHNAADGRPAEFVWAAVENVNGLKWESPMIETDFEISFVAEPEVWYDDQKTVDLLLNRTTGGVNVYYNRAIQYAGPDAHFFADAEALPLLSLTVADINAAQINTSDPPYIDITNSQDAQTFRLYPIANIRHDLDSYNETIRAFFSFGVPEIYEAADYDQFIYLVGAAASAGLTNTLSLTCHHCDLSAATAAYFGRHF